jgi:hypothetical protein
VAADREYELNQSIPMAKQRTALECLYCAKATGRRHRFGSLAGLPFTEKQIALVTTLRPGGDCDENARLFNECAQYDRTREFGRRAKMLNEVAQAVS